MEVCSPTTHGDGLAAEDARVLDNIAGSGPVPVLDRNIGGTRTVTVTGPSQFLKDQYQDHTRITPGPDCGEAAARSPS